MTRLVVRVIALSLLFGVVLWVLDAFYEFRYFESEVNRMLFQEPLSFSEWLILKVPHHDLFNRFLFLAASLGGGVLAAAAMVKLKRREEQLNRSEVMLQDVFHSIQDGILVLDGDLKILRANRTVMRWFGRGESIVGRACYKAIAERGTVCQACECAAALVTGKMQTGERRLNTIDGEDRRIEVFAYPMVGPGGHSTGVVEYIRDVTDQRRGESERHELEDLLRQSQKMEALGQLAGGVAHDFNNLLQVIEGATGLALEDTQPGSRVRDELGHVRHAVERAGDLVRQLLLFGRRSALEPRALDVNALIAGLTKMLHRVIGEHIELICMPTSDLPPVMADPGQIEQVLMNLCVNARDAMGEGGRLTIETESVYLDPSFVAHHPWADVGEHVCIAVHDTGAGIPPDIRDRVFEPFFTTKEAGKGTGLGLATVYAIAQRHGGGVTVTSTTTEESETPGTTISVYLPAAAPNASDTGVAQSDAPTENHEGAVVLLAEDDPPVADLAQRILEKAGFTVVAATDGNEAIEIFNREANRFDVAVLDVVMPGCSGRAVADHIQAVRPRLPILFCSGYDFAILDNGLVPEQGTRLLRKPYRAAELIASVREVITASGHHVQNHP